MKASPLGDTARAGAALYSVSGNWATERDIFGPTIVLVHGFTANGGYLRRLGDFFSNSGFSVLLFEYDSYLGIDRGADDLMNRLNSLGEPLRVNGLILVGHSMGGLVCRQLLRIGVNWLLGSVKGLVCLGTPHRGVGGGEIGRKMVNVMVRWSEIVSAINPYARTLACAAASQLCCGDQDSLIEAINRSQDDDPCAYPIVTISGGLNFIEQEDNGTFGFAQQRMIQAWIGEKPNDGLVGESNSDLRSALRIESEERNQRFLHNRSYRDWERTNHTNLTENQEIAEFLLDWARGCFECAI